MVAPIWDDSRSAVTGITFKEVKQIYNEIKLFDNKQVTVIRRVFKDICWKHVN